MVTPQSLQVATPTSSDAPTVVGGGGAATDKRPAVLAARYLDLVVLAIATPIAIVMGAPVLGYAIGAGAWVAQRVLAMLDRRWLARLSQQRMQLGVNLFEAFGRIWLLAGAIVAAGLIGARADGLTAALVIFISYSICFAVRMMSGLQSRGPAL
jgi:hypothetical protein